MRFFPFGLTLFTFIIVPRTFSAPLKGSGLASESIEPPAQIRAAVQGILAGYVISESLRDLDAEAFDALVQQVLDDPTAAEAQVINEAVAEFSNSEISLLPESSRLSDKTKRIFFALDPYSQSLILGVALALGGSRSQMEGNAGPASSARTSGTPSDVQDGPGDLSDTGDTTAPTATTHGPSIKPQARPGLAHGSGNTKPSSSGAVGAPADDPASDGAPSTDPPEWNSSRNTVPQLTSSAPASTKPPAAPNSTLAMSQWYQKPTDLTTLYLRCINKAEADALVKKMQGAKIGPTEIEKTKGEIAVYQVGANWVKPSWCSSVPSKPS